MSKPKSSVFDKWTKIVDDFVNSNLSPKEYCQRTGVNINTLYTWRSRLGRVRDTASDIPGFHEVRVRKESPINKADFKDSIEVLFGSNIKISLTGDFNEDIFLKVVKVLSRALC